MAKLRCSSVTLLLLLVTLCLLPLLAHSSECECSEEDSDIDKTEARKLHIVAIFAILAASTIGCSIPALGRWIPAISPDKDYYFLIKAFAAGIILATGFIHILPDAIEKLTSPCLPESPWQDFPFAGFGAMIAAIGTLMMDTIATGYFSRRHFKKAASSVNDLEATVEAERGHADHVHVHTQASHGHTHGAAMMVDAATNGDRDSQLIRNRVISKVLELGIIVHSVIIGMSVGASDTPSTIRPLIAALTFHQFFEGLGLGSCIAQGKFRLKSVVIMSIFFSLTTPVGIVIGIGIASNYNENSHTALIVEGLLDSVSAGILIYMSLVDLLAEDFMNPRVQNRGMLQLLINIFLLLGAGLSLCL
ncbi:zinc transporter 8-like protein [Carex littledalei]|uniref:Zinc transporter 8-like protein n=1 Tax=Carex littledalei TaxID=544730 RepID=A0A833RK02_9POAL|nr:zinc transporter 8-like protein [Carex littledalei]